MPTINLLDCLPQPLDGSPKQLLPKQQEFFDAVLNQSGPKYVLYAGGVGSAKTTIGCLTVIALAAMYPGDYLVCRQFQPELKLTTYKTFMQMCPKELIVKEHIADGTVTIRSTGGKTSSVIFRGLDEPDKHRSLNLNAAYIDESSQVSEAAFGILQSRIRGQFIRKIIMTTNPAGHDWQYNLFIKQDSFTDETKKMFRLIRAPSTENKFLPDGYVDSLYATWSRERIQREVEASFDAFEGAVYSEFRRDTHVIKPFAIPSDWTRVVGVDHGYRNPAAWIYGAVDPDGTIYIYDEFYEREWLIEEICQGKMGSDGKKILGAIDRLRKPGKNTEYYIPDYVKIDPSVKARRGTNGESDWDMYLKSCPDWVPFQYANNEKVLGIDRVKSYLKPDVNTCKPRLYIFDTCKNLTEEMSQYRYVEQTMLQQGNANPKEEPRKVNDHALDALRYLLMGQPEPTQTVATVWDTVKYNSLQGRLIRDFQAAKAGKKTNFDFNDV